MSGQFLVTNRKELTEFERGKIIALSEKGQSVRKISNDLRYPKSTVQDTISRYKAKGDTHSAPRSGCPPSLDGGCFYGTGLGPLVLIEGKLNRFGYIQLLEENLLP
jgi:hypothetical protein